jgi:hypothetical protein
MTTFFAEPLRFLRYHTRPPTAVDLPWVVRERTRWKDPGRGWPRFTGTERECRIVAEALNTLSDRR